MRLAGHPFTTPAFMLANFADLCGFARNPFDKFVSRKGAELRKDAKVQGSVQSIHTPVQEFTSLTPRFSLR